jgi:uncharacterized membrane protein YgdD (TMEM256/DUF423 family)
MMSGVFFLIGAFGGFLSVALGAFAAHGLKSNLSPEMLGAFETGVRYQMYHSLALLVTGYAARDSALRQFSYAGCFFASGIVLFSGSLYALATTGITRLGAVTPFGGLAFLAGWCLLGYGFWKSGRQR